jgi:hypothetical protein
MKHRCHRDGIVQPLRGAGRGCASANPVLQCRTSMGTPARPASWAAPCNRARASQMSAHGLFCRRPSSRPSRSIACSLEAWEGEGEAINPDSIATN